MEEILPWGRFETSFLQFQGFLLFERVVKETIVLFYVKLRNNSATGHANSVDDDLVIFVMELKGPQHTVAGF